MKFSKKQAPLIYSGIGVLSAAVVAAGVFARRYILRRKAAQEAGEADESGQSSLVEELVTHNTKGF